MFRISSMSRLLLTPSEAFHRPHEAIVAGLCVLTGAFDGGAGVGVLGAGLGALLVALVLIGRHARVAFEGVGFADRTREST